MKMRTLIIDDEPIARKIIKEYLEDVPFIDIAGEAENAFEAVKMLKDLDIDLIFLDIEMPKINGLSLLDTLSPRPLTIITTAHQQFALKGYELDVLDYILKPISQERILKAVNKAADLYKVKFTEKSDFKDSFFIKTDNRLQKISVPEIYFIEAANNYVLLHTANDKMMAYLTTKSLEASLPKGQFIRIHKSYIVATDKIQSIEGDELSLENGKVLPVGSHYYQQVMKFVREREMKR